MRTPDEGSYRVLIVEDDWLQAAWLARVVTRAGYEVVGPVASELSALMEIGQDPPDTALVDIDLSGQGSLASRARPRTSARVMAALDDWGVPFVVVTSHRRVAVIPPTPRCVETLLKPVRENEVLRALDRALDLSSRSA